MMTTCVRTAVTVTFSCPDCPLKAAVIVALPALMAETTPKVETVASAVLEEVQVACEVTSFVEESLYVAVAVICSVPPAFTEEVDDVTATPVTVRLVTVRPSLPDLPLKVAVIVAAPLATPVTRPAVETVASLVFEEVHVACEVTFCVDESLYVAVAVI